MRYTLDGHEINNCLRCQGDDLLISYPVLFCKTCGTINSVYNNELCAVFTIGKYRVRIMKDKSYINDTKIDVVLPYDISSEDKLHTYLVFS